MSLAQEIAVALHPEGKAVPSGSGGFVTLCPVHDDSNPSLSLKDDDKGGVIVHCHAGCDYRDVKDKLVSMGLLPGFQPGRKKTYSTGVRATGVAGKPAQQKQPDNSQKALWIWDNADKDRAIPIKFLREDRAITIDPGPCCRYNEYTDKKTGETRRSMMFSVTRLDDKAPAAISQTPLDEDGHKTGKAWNLGPCASEGRGVWFDRKAPPFILLAGEGVETVLSGMQVMGYPGVAGLTAGGLEALVFPDETDTLYILVDSDHSFTGQKASINLAEKFEASASGRTAFLVSPDHTCFTDTPTKQDFNDLLQADPSGESIKKQFDQAIRLEALEWRPPEKETHSDKLRKTPGEVISELSSNLGSGKDISDKWCEILRSANLSTTGTDEVINYLVSQNVGSKRSLKKDYKSHLGKNDAETKDSQLQELAGYRRLVEYNQLDFNSTVEATEQGVIDVPDALPYFNFGGALAYSTYDKPSKKATGIDDEAPPDVPVVKMYNHDSLQLRVERSVLHYKTEYDEAENPIKTPVPTPSPVISKMLNNPMPLAPRVTGLVSHPIVSLDGRVINQEGVDDKTGLLLQFGGARFTVPESPTADDSQEAVERIKQILFTEFCFEDDPKTPNLYLIATLAVLLTAIFRKVIDQAPGSLICANVQGTGKTTLARIIHMIATGRDMPVSSLGGSVEETQKAMLSALLQSPAMLCFDNILDGSEIHDPTLAQVITSPYFQGRILGKSQEVSVNTNTLFVFTGNNVTVSVDLVRRFLPVRLTTDVSQPETRTFNHPDIVQHCLNVRSAIIYDCLVIVKAYLDAGAPLDSVGLVGSGFPQWDRMVRFPLLGATGTDVVEAMNTNREQSTEHQAMTGIIEGLWAIFTQRSFSATEVLNLLQEYDSDLERETVDHLRECVALQSPKALQNTRSLSWVLKKMKGRIINGKELGYSTNNFGNLGRYVLVNRNG